MVLSVKVLRPISSGIQNPFASAINELDLIMAQQPDYYIEKWPEIKRRLVTRALGLKANGSFLRGAALTAPNHLISEGIFEIRELVDYSSYCISQYWRAFQYWLDKGGRFNPRWPQFGQEDALLAVNNLSVEQLHKVTDAAKQTWPNMFEDEQQLNLLVKKLQKPIKRICWKRLRYLSRHDPAVYEAEDLEQEVIMMVIQKLRTSDHYNDDINEMIGWGVTCATNAVEAIGGYAQSLKRAKIIRVKEDKEGDSYLVRDCALSTPLDEDGFTLGDSISVLGDDAFRENNEVYDHFCFQQILEKSPPEIKTYLKIIWGGEHNPDFWIWFTFQEPERANEETYLHENPEAIGPWVQRWLNLSSRDLLTFLKKELPSFYELTQWKKRKLA